MGDTDPIAATTDTGPREAASTSSGRTGESQEADPLAALGERIIAELGDPRTNSTLTRWLAHHVARLIREADTARETGAPDADARDRAARDAILQLWQARSTWPAGWPPPRAAEVVRLLDSLPDLDDPDGWYRQTVLGRLQDLHYHILSILVDLVIGDADTDLEQRWLETFEDVLTSDEATLLRRVAARPRRLELLLKCWQRRSDEDDIEVRVTEPAEPETQRTNPLLRLADAYQAAVADLIQHPDASSKA